VKEKEMAIVGVLETGMFFGTINTSASTSAQHNFGPSSVWSRPYVQSFFNNDDDGSIDLKVSQFKDNKGTHNGSFHPGIIASNCTSVTFHMSTIDSIGEAVLTTEFFG
jgi:hypothetical protein